MSIDVFIITIYFLGFILLINIWFRYYRKIIKVGIEYVGNDAKQENIILKPNEKLKIKLHGKATIIVSGVNPWLTIKYNGIKQKIYKIRLLNYIGEIELINESKIFTLSVTILTE
ncbi:hypothetical protein EWF20_12855 [Sulfolobus sp. S-194]|uniref:hypothetical protein n=1 Tax=Sulfolobus sp. S-194 TaxID=2512240 RepID=UPI0014370089|nr:hypothetical protein [Sulfolobus sp. S-194]QIW24929.1 hypothetical protein EWF20_12855 [Sulfolobus sp. S-194]